MLEQTHKIRFLALTLVLAGGFTAPVTTVDRAVDLGYSRHIVERLPDYDVEAILESQGTAGPAISSEPVVDDSSGRNELRRLQALRPAIDRSLDANELRRFLGLRTSDGSSEAAEHRRMTAGSYVCRPGAAVTSC